jgi:hypothetical protein
MMRRAFIAIVFGGAVLASLWLFPRLATGQEMRQTTRVEGVELRKWVAMPVQLPRVVRACGEYFSTYNDGDGVEFIVSVLLRSSEEEEPVKPMFRPRDLRVRIVEALPAPRMRVLGYVDDLPRVEIAISPRDLEAAPCLRDVPLAV